jgi:hypothetical protein
MTVFQRWNRQYDALPELWRFQFILWPLILLGTINMALTVSRGFPFGLLVAIALVVLLVVRVPYVMSGGGAVAAGPAVEPKIHVDSFPWVYDANLWYDGLPEDRQAWVILAILGIAGGINMLLSIHGGFPFGLLFLLALLAIVLIRAPYVNGWLVAPTPFKPATAAPPAQGQIAHDATIAAAPAYAVAAEPATIVAHEPPVVHIDPPPPPPMAAEEPPLDKPA